MRNLPLSYSARVTFTTALGIFVGLLAIAHVDPDDFAALDTFATHALAPLRAMPWVEAFIGITALGNSLSIVAVALGVALLLRRNRTLVVRLGIAVIGTSLSVQLVKQFIARARPDTLVWLGPIHSYSFPSGHAATALALFGCMAVIASRLPYSRALRAGSVLVLAILILLVGMSRIVLAAHYASDVLAGYTLGLAWLSLAFLLPIPSRSQLRARMKL